MDDLTIARALHVLAVVFWIGGVGFVTLVVMPMLNADERAEHRLRRFEQIEGRFAWQARMWVLLTGLTGFWMASRADMWSRFADVRFWWMHLMLALWTVFALMLFLIEPLFLHRRMAASPTPAADFARMQRMHQVLLAIGAVTIIGAVGGAHGLF